MWEFAFFSAMLISEEPIDEDGIIEVSADRAAASPIILYSAIHTGDSAPTTVYRAEWSVIGDGFIIPPVQNNTEGIFSSGLQLPTAAGSDAIAKVSFGTSNPQSIYSAKYKVVPGEPDVIEVTQSGVTGIGGLASVMLDITVKDAYGNLVADGTQLEVLAPDMEINGNLLTIDGQAHIAVKGINSAGTKSVEITANQVRVTEPVEVADIDVIIDLDSEIEVGTLADVHVSVSSSYSDLTGLPVRISSFRGDVTEKEQFVSGGVVTTQLNVGDFRGDGKLFVLIGGTIYEEAFSVIEPAGEPRLLDPVVISDVSSPGSFSAGGREFQYTNNTYLVVNGTPGETVDVSLMDYLDPPFVPSLEFSMKHAPQSGVVSDFRRGREGAATNITYNSAKTTATTRGAYQFGDSSHIVVEDNTGLVKQGQVGFTIQFNAETTSGTLLEYSAAGLTLRFSGDSLTLTQSTDSGDEILSTSSLSTGQWYRVGAHSLNGELILQVDEDVFTTTLSGTPVSESSGDAVIIGNSYTGFISEVALYDWDEESALHFANGQLTQSATVQSDGQAMVSIQTNPAAAIAAREERQRRLTPDDYNFFIQSAYAATADDCHNFVVDDIKTYSAAEAFLKFVLECKIQERIDKAKVKVTQAGNTFDQYIAFMEFAVYQLTYVQMYATTKVVGFLPDCANGAVMGNADTGAGAVCDLVSSLFVIGDIRDFVLHSYYLYDDESLDEDQRRFDKPTYVFATLGLLTTLAEASGVGVVLDAALAGCKVSAKMMRGSEVMKNLADFVDEALLDVPISQMDDAAKTVLPLMQIVAMVGFYGEDLKDFVVAAVRNKEDFNAWKDYLYFFVNHPDYAEEITANPPFLLRFFITDAYAAISDDLVDILTTRPIQDFIKILEDVNKIGSKVRSDQTLIGRAFTRALKELEELDRLNLGPEEIRAILHKAPTIKATLLLYHLGGESNDLLKALRRFPCTPSKCGMGESMEAFMGNIADIADLIDTGKLTETATTNLKEVFGQLGQLVKKQGSELEGQPNLNLSRGAVGVITMLRRLADEGKVIDDFEVSEIIHDVAGNKFAGRVMDIKTTDGTLYEIKGWKTYDLAILRLLGGEDKKGFLSTQMLSDLVKRSLDPSDTRIWRFSDEVLEAQKPQIIDAILDKFENDPELLRDFARPLGIYKKEELAALIKIKNNGRSEVENLLHQLMGI
ncbi:MAG: hypothetical protein PVI97_08525 [Candidatus Thiodiazotropha sp.]